jgi:aspartate/methionine/tyrosine aminotransferase
MKLPYFKTEQWMTDHEQRAVYNLTDTCVQPLTLAELEKMDKDHLLSSVTLDYGTITGDIRLKQEILKLYVSGSEDNLTMAAGCSQANELVMAAMLDQGDHVIAFMPGYEQFIRLPESIGCSVSVLPLYEENSWQPSIDDVRQAVRPDTRMILLNNPNNPTGIRFREDFMKELISLARERNIYILADEVYRDYHMPSISDQYEKGIAASSLSKMFSLAGLRLGWVKGPQEVIAAINCRRDYSLISTGPLADTLGLIALQNKDEIHARSRRLMEEDRRVVTAWLAAEPRAHVQLPEEGPVCFLKYDMPVDSRTVSEELLDRYGVFFVPGWCFDCEHHLRLGLTREPDRTAEGLRLFSRYMDEKTGR